MPSARRRNDTGLIQQLLDAPYRFEYFQAVRLLEHYFAGQRAIARDVVPQHVRFRNSLSLSFPPSELEAAEAQDAAGEPIDAPLQRAHALEAGDVATVSLTPAFFGLLGTNGALPLQYTERLVGREIYRRDRAARAFFDLFTTRSAALFYAAWKKYRPSLHYELDGRRDKQALPIMLSLAGTDFSALRTQLTQAPGEISLESAGFHAGTFWRRPVSAVMVQRVVADYFGVDVRLEQFVPRWYPVPESQRTFLGQNNATLCGGAIAGERVLQCDLCVRLWIGPLRKADFSAFLPGGDRAAALKKLVQRMTGVRLEYEVRLILAAEDVQCAQLGSTEADGGGRLGWDAFVISKRPQEPRADTTYHIA
ncbi:type VI secretion system baseplate subunit TssG [Salinisphaera sp. Q1T1-3]|uniref:type VI secretion system baseplate subunit TssG n=1 Tax=Salinisphaera sp. Q1T1-3 TaxID=2321229 RepID=UPI000E72CEEA|nr:type VI secretion system baseplate subunit TssG [Salinisphaera sp. Q1T1-3]RJS91694.1 type VI secretion system baseplate subunit TssG [Salinisphaera sp. Q1T1-3]